MHKIDENIQCIQSKALSNIGFGAKVLLNIFVHIMQ